MKRERKRENKRDDDGHPSFIRRTRKYKQKQTNKTIRETEQNSKKSETQNDIQRNQMCEVNRDTERE